MAGCNTGRNIQKYKGGGASTLQDALENGNTASLNINLSSPAVFVGDGGGLSNINASATSGNLQAVTDNAATTTNKITLTNGLTSLVTSGNVLVTGNVTASFFRGDGGTLSNVAANKNFQEVTDFGSTSSNKITLTNSSTSLQTTGKIVSLTLEANVNASNIVTADGRGINQLNASNVSIGTLAIARGGTGADTASAAASALGVGTEDSPQFTAIELGHASDTTLARSSAGVVTIEGVEIRTGTVPVAKGGTGATSASAAASALGVGTEDSPQFTAIELGHASDTTLARSSAGVVTIEGVEIRTGTVPVAKGGTGATTLNNLITMATHTTGDFVGTITGGDGIASSAGTTGEDTDHTLSIDAKANGGLVIESNKLAVDLAASSITGTLAVGDGGTGATTLDNLITMGTHTTGNFVQTITGGDGIASTGATSGENIAHSLSVDAKANGGLVIESNKLAVDLAASSITGTLAVGDGGTGATTLNNLITMGTHTSGDFVGTITGGDGIASSAGTTGEDTDHTLSIDAKANGGLVIESNKLAVDLAASSITGTLTAGDGGTGHSSYTVGQLLVASGTAAFTPLTPGTSGHFLKSQGAGSALAWASVTDVGSPTEKSLFTGDYLTGANNDGSNGGGHTGADHTTIHADATTTNTAGKLVARDSSGDIRVQEVIVGTTGGTTGSLTSTAWSGSAATLTTARDIGGVSFDGSGSISLPGVDTTGSQNTTGSAATLTTARDIGGVSFDGSGSISLPGVDTTGSQNTTGSAATLTTARDIGGVSFDGSASISLPGVNAPGNQDTSGSAAKIASVDSTSPSQLPVPFMSAATGDVTLNSDSGVLQYQASSGTLSSTIFSGSGASLTSLPVSELSAAVPVTKGGTGLATVTAGDILYASADNTIAARGKGDNGQFLTLSGGFPAWASVSSTTMGTTNVTIEDTDHGLIFVSDSGTGAQALKKEYGTLKYKPSTGTLTTSNVITSDTSIHARNGIANTTPTHTLDIGSRVSVIDDGIDKLVIRGNVYSTHDIISLGTIHTDILKAKDAFIKNTTVVAERPTRQVRLN